MKLSELIGKKVYRTKKVNGDGSGMSSSNPYEVIGEDAQCVYYKWTMTKETVHNFIKGSDWDDNNWFAAPSEEDIRLPETQTLNFYVDAKTADKIINQRSDIEEIAFGYNTSKWRDGDQLVQIIVPVIKKDREITIKESEIRKILEHVGTGKAHQHSVENLISMVFK